MNMVPQNPFVSVLPTSIRKSRVWLTVLPLLAAAFAQGATLDIKLSDGTHSWEWTPSIVDLGNGSGKINDISYSPGAASINCYNMTLDYDPFFSASVDVVNNTLTTQNYTLTFTLPVSPSITGGTKMGGSTQGGLTDANNDSVGTLSTVGANPLYYGQVDGVNVLPLFSSPTAMNVPFQGGSTSSFTSAGLPGPTLVGPASLNTSIGIQHQFSLTAGDRATFTSFFTVVAAIPEPGTLSLLAIGGLALVWRRRR